MIFDVNSYNLIYLNKEGVSWMDAIVKIGSERLQWAITSSGADEIEFMNKFSFLKTDDTNDYTVKLTQLIKISSELHIPLAYFLSEEIPEEEVDLIKFRTINNDKNYRPSVNLSETIKDMEEKQEFMSLSRKNDDYEPLQFIKSITIKSDVIGSADKIRSVLELSPEWNKEADNPFKYLKEKLNDAGILVMQNGVVKNNTRRKLNIEEFRGFVIMDEYAPLIFINSQDSTNGKLFTLIHEMVHVFLGQDDLNNSGSSNDIGFKKNERYCNKVTAELLISYGLRDDILKWTSNSKDLIYSVSKLFKGSEHFAAFRLKELNIISRKQYEDLIIEISKNKEEYKKIQKKESGGDFYKNILSEPDNSFIQLVDLKAKNGEILYREAYRLTGSKGKGYDNIVNMAGNENLI